MSKKKPAAPRRRAERKSDSARAAGKARAAEERALRGARRRDFKPCAPIRPGNYSALGYEVVTVASREGRSYTGGSGDFHFKYQRDKIIDQSRAFDRDNCIYAGIVDRAVDNIVATGFGLQIKSGDENYDARAEAQFEMWGKKPEARGLFSFAQVEEFLLRETLVAGDMGFIKLNLGKKAGRLQLIEAERITDGKLGTGVLIDKEGAPTAYQVMDYTRQGGQVDRRTRRDIPVDDFMFMFKPRRSSQTRGLPAAQSAFSMLHRINDVCDSEALAWQILARLALTVNRESAAQNAYDVSRENPDAESSSSQFNIAQRIQDFGWGVAFHGGPGEKIAGVERNIPGKNFPESLRMFLRLMGLPMGLPLELVLMDWSESNYSSARAALEQAFVNFIRWQRVMIASFHDPLLRWLLDLWETSGAIPSRPKGRGEVSRKWVTWITPEFPWLDQLKEAQAWGVKLERGLATHTTALKSLNHDRDEHNATREREFVSAIRIAQNIEKETGVAVPWEHFAGLRPKGDRGTKEEGDPSNPRSPEPEKRAPRTPREED